MKYFTKTATFCLIAFIFCSCGPTAEEQAARDKALVDSTVRATVKSMSENNSKNSISDNTQNASSEKSFAKKVEPVEVMTNFDWSGKYSGGDDYVTFTLTVNSDAPLRWAEYGWEMEAIGIQTFYKIKGYALRDEKGNLDLHFLEKVDGAFYQEENMDMNKTMFKLRKKGKVYKPMNGIWKVTDFVSTFKK